MIQLFNKTRKLSLSNFKGSKYLRCPACGKLKLKPYAYENGEIEHESLGRCQREFNCNYHLKPSEYFKEKGESFYNTPTFSQPKELETYTINRDIVEIFASNFKNSTLYQYLQATGIDYTEAFERYKIGASKDGSTIFFQFDGAKFRAGKIIKYVNGHRDKSNGFPVQWYHKRMKDLNEATHALKQCFFGRHLIDYSDVVCLVESEKTALICSQVFKQAAWMATGGRTKLNIANLSELSKKRVLLFPDDDSIDYWREKTANFPNCEIINLSKFNVSDKKGADLADYLLEMGVKIQKEIYFHVISVF